MARTVKVPPGRRERLCWAALAASSEAHRITSSALGQSSRTAREVSSYSADVLGGAGVGGLNVALPEYSGFWGVHGSSLRRLVRDLCNH